MKHHVGPCSLGNQGNPTTLAGLFFISTFVLLVGWSKPAFAVDFFVTADANGDGRTSLQAAIASVNDGSASEIHRIIFTEAMTVDVGVPLAQVVNPVEVTGEQVPGYDGSPLVEFRGTTPTSSAGLVFGPNSAIRVNGIRFQDVGVGIVLAERMTDIEIRDCQFVQNGRGIAMLDDFPRTDAIDGLRILNNTFLENTTAVDLFGIEVLVPSQFRGLSNVEVRSNTFESNGDGLAIALSETSTIAENHFEGSTGSAVILQDTSDTTVSENNQFVDNIKSIRIVGGDHVAIEDNEFTTPTQVVFTEVVGISIDWSASGITKETHNVSIVNNVLNGAGSIVGGTGILANDDAYFSLTVDGNTLFAYEDAIQLGSFSSFVLGAEVTGNLISDSATGIRANDIISDDGSVVLRLRSNDIARSGSGIVLDHCDLNQGTRIEDNTLLNNLQGVLLLASEAILSQNIFVSNSLGTSIQESEADFDHNLFANNFIGVFLESSLLTAVRTSDFINNGEGIRASGGTLVVTNSTFGGSTESDGNDVGIHIRDDAFKVRIGEVIAGKSVSGSVFMGNTTAIQVDSGLHDTEVRASAFGGSTEPGTDSMIIDGTLVTIEDNTMLEGFGGLDCMSQGEVYFSHNELFDGSLAFSGGIVYDIFENTMQGEVPVSFGGGIRYAEVRSNELTGPVLIHEDAHVGLTGNIFSGTGLMPGDKLVDLALGSNAGNTSISSPTQVLAIRGDTEDVVEGMADGPGTIEIYASNADGTVATALLGSAEVLETGAWSTSEIDLGGVEYVIVNRSRVLQARPTLPQDVVTSEFSAPVQVQGGVPAFTSLDSDGVVWESAAGAVSVNTENRVEGTASLQVNNTGWIELLGPRFRTADFGAVGTELSLDVYLPEDPAGQSPWPGTLQLWVTIPAAGLDNVYLGLVDLAARPRNAWSTATFSVPEDIRQAWLGDYADARVRIALNTNLQPVLLDHLRFTGELTDRTIFHELGSSTYPVATNPLMSMDSLGDWSSSVALTREFVLRTEGESGLGVSASGYTVVESRSFSTTELAGVSDQLNVDLYIPQPQPDPQWIGAVQLYVSCGPLSNQYVGQVDLTHLFEGEFNSLLFALPVEVQDVFRSSYSDCSLTLALNVASGAGTFVVDNLGFVQL